MTPEQQALLDKAQRSIVAAQKLLQECFYEFSVSRSYYAMFYVAEAFLDKEGLSFSSHGAVIGAFGQHLARTNKVPVEFHRQLIDAQAQRTRADYDPQPDMTQEDAETLILQAQTFLTTALESL
jgi:uncharacterized protein (UPF0332 family)